MAKLYILCGPSGSGKSTWAKNFRKEHEHVAYVSRDNIRLAMLTDDEDYFSHEKEVFKHFVATIAHYIQDDNDVIADATHLNEFSRRKLTQAIDMRFKNYEIIYVVFNVDIDTCLARNERRANLAAVPETVIRNMCRDFRAPTYDEDERIIDIITITIEKGVM